MPASQRSSRRHGSLAVRTVLSSLVLGVLLIAALIIAVTAWMRSDVFDSRTEVLLEDARHRAQIAQSVFDASSAASASDVTELAAHEVAALHQTPSGSGAIGILLERSPEETSTTVVRDITTDPSLRSLVSDDLRRAVSTGPIGTQYWQSTPVPVGESTSPGLVVATTVTLPHAGAYQLYVIYSLAPEQRVIDLATRAVVITGLGFLALLLTGIWLVTRTYVVPIQRTAVAAERLASGELSERVPVIGDDEIATLATSFNEMAASLQQQIEAWERLSEVERLFVSDVSHELRTPLASIRLAAEQIWESRDEIEDPLALRSLEILLREIDRFEQMLVDLLEISRIDSGQVQLRAEETDLTAVVRGVLDVLDVHATQAGTRVRLSAPAEPVIAEIDSTRVERIIRNLLVNAIDHAEGRPIDVAVAQDEGAVAVRVRDHGVGMSPDVVRKVFDRFYRVDPSRSRTLGGTGLGLSIALEDATLHGGTLRAWGWPADGACFLLTLPRVLGPGASQGTLPGPGPLELVPEDAPEVARPGREPEPPRPGPMGVGPASRRTVLDRDAGPADGGA